MSKQIIAALLIIVFCGCSQKDFVTKYNFAEKKLTPKKYYYTLISKSDIEAITESNNITSNTNATLGFYYQLQTDSVGNRIVKITYDKFHITVSKNDDEVDVYDSEKEGDASPLMDRVLAALKGATITVTADVKGNILSTVGTKEISDKINSLLPNYEGDDNEVVKKQLEDFIGAKFIKDNVTQNLSIIPDTALNIGSTWSQKTNLNGAIPIDATINYSLANVENGIGTINATANFENTADKPISIIGITANADLKGEITGKYKALEKSGFLINAETTLKIAGTLYVTNKEIPVNIKISKIIKAVDLNE